MHSEPAISVASITAAVTAVLALLVSFGVSLSPDQQLAILGVVAVVGPLVVGLVTRGRVYAPETVEERILDAEAVTAAADADPSSPFTLARPGDHDDAA